jgi:hypothetical protein
MILMAAVGALGLLFATDSFASPPPAPLPPPLRAGLPPQIEGLIYQDPQTQVILYVETDGRHIAAISPQGKLLWRKDPFVEGGLEPYRHARPVISWVGQAAEWVRASGKSGHVIGISFDSSQFGVMDVETGKFRFLGQD